MSIRTRHSLRSRCSEGLRDHGTRNSPGNCSRLRHGRHRKGTDPNRLPPRMPTHPHSSPGTVRHRAKKRPHPGQYSPDSQIPLRGCRCRRPRRSSHQGKGPNSHTRYRICRCHMRWPGRTPSRIPPNLSLRVRRCNINRSHHNSKRRIHRGSRLLFRHHKQGLSPRICMLAPR
jgi:hypothetical protein